MSDTQAAAIEAGIAAREEQARAATQDARWTRYDHGGGRLDTRHLGDRRRLVLDAYGDGADREFYAAHSPASVLVRCARDRKALADAVEGQADCERYRATTHPNHRDRYQRELDRLAAEYGGTT